MKTSQGGESREQGATEGGGSTIVFETTRFGAVEVPDDKVIRFPDGLLGFPEQQRYVLVQNPSGGPFQWLQSVDEPALAFVAAEPGHFFENYAVPASSEELRALCLESMEDAVVLVLLVVPPDPSRITANLQGPLLINPDARVGRQLVLQVPEYTTRHAIFPAGTSAGEGTDGAAPDGKKSDDEALESIGAKRSGRQG